MDETHQSSCGIEIDSTHIDTHSRVLIRELAGLGRDTICAMILTDDTNRDR